MMEWLRKNWLNILLAIISAISGADAAVGIRDGKSPANLTVIPSILASLGTAGTLGIRWLNSRTVFTRRMREGLPGEFSDRLETLYLLARDPDVTAEHASHLAAMAGDILIAEHQRAQVARRSGQVKVMDGTASAVPALTDLEKRLSVVESATAKRE